MKMKKLAAAFLIVGSISAVPAHAGIPVFDGANVMQAIQQLIQMYEQLDQLKNQLDEAKKNFNSLNGIRGMAGLINDPAARRYLPATAQELYKLYNGGASGGYSGLSGSVEALKRTNRVLDASGLGDTETAKALNEMQGQLALMQATAELAYSSADRRFDSYQQLIGKLNETPDPKAIAELQGRIQAEQVMMQNEQSKLMMMQQLASAKMESSRQQSRERSAKLSKGQPIYATDYRLPTN